MYKKTEFDSITITKNARQIINLGQGKVDAVQFKINRYLVGTNTVQDVQNIYYGSNNNCTCELLPSTADAEKYSPVLPCTDLDEMTLQYTTGTDETCEVQIIKYYL